MNGIISAILGLVDLIVVCGNIFVLYLLASQPSLRSSTNSIVLSLTLSDLLLGLIILPFSIMQEHHGIWLYGETFCRLWLSLDVFLSTASIYNLLAITVDRYMAVRQPIRYPIISSQRVVRQMISLVWISALSLSLILLMIQRDTKGNDLCSPLSFPNGFIIASASVSFLIPAILMIVLNLLIFQRVHTSRRQKSFKIIKGKKNGESLRIHRGINKVVVNAHGNSTKEENRRSIDADKENNQDRNEQEWSDHSHVNSIHVRALFSNLLLVSLAHTKRRTQVLSSIPSSRGIAPSLRTELRVARTAFVVVAAFVLCWFPFMTIYLLQTYEICPHGTCVPDWLFTVTFWLGYANSALNPILYAAFSRDFRAAFRRVILHPIRPR